MWKSIGLAMKIFLFLTMILISNYDLAGGRESFDQYIKKQDLSTIDHGGISFIAGKLAQMGRCQDAIDFCDRVLEHQPNHPEADCSKGLALSQAQRYEESLVQYDLAIQYDYEFTPAAYYYKGLSLFRLKRYEEALAAHDTAIAMGLDDRDTSWARECALHEVLKKK